MFQETIVEIIQRVNRLEHNKKSITELDIQDIKEEIQETLFSINFTPQTIEEQEFNTIQKLNVSNKEALGLFFLTFVTTLKNELSYNSLWVGIIDALLEYEEDNNTFFVDNYCIDESELGSYLNEAIIAAILKFNLRDGYDNEKPTDTVLLQMGLLNRFTNINYWLSANSKNSIIENLTNRTNPNYSKSFHSGWKVLQRYSQSLLSKKETFQFLKHNVWFKDLNIEELLSASKTKLHSPLISKNEIENNFFLTQLFYRENTLQFILDVEDLYSINLKDESYDIYIDGVFHTKLSKEELTKNYSLDTLITIEEPENYKIDIKIKDIHQQIIYEEECVLFDFNHDILIFDEHGRWYTDPNQKLDTTKTYSLLIDSDFDITNADDTLHEYFDGYVHLVTNIKSDSNFTADDGDQYQFSLNFTQQIKAPTWLNQLELYAMSDFLSFDEPIKYQLRFNNITVSARQVDELIDITQEFSIVRWSYTGGVVYDLDAIENWDYTMELSYDILLNRKNTLKIQVGDTVFTKQLNVTFLEKTIKPKYRTFLKNSQENITFIKETNRLKDHDLISNKIIITSFHEDLSTMPELKTQVLRDKTNIFDRCTVNKFFTLSTHPFYGEEISSVKKIYDDVQWNTFCNIKIQGIIKNYDEKKLLATLHSDSKITNMTLITLDTSYRLSTHLVDTTQNTLQLPHEVLGFCLLNDGQYIGSFFTENDLDIETIFASVAILQFLRLSYYPFAEYFNGTEYEKNRAFRERARNEKKKAKRLLRVCIKNNPSIFLKAFIEDSFVIDDITIALHFDHSKAIAEQILFAIEFDTEESLKIIHEIILNRWQEKLVKLPLFLLYILNNINNERYYHIFIDELDDTITQEDGLDEEFVNRMINALLSDHKINRFEKINIKTITQGKHKDFYIRKALHKLIDRANEPEKEEEKQEQE